MARGGDSLRHIQPMEEDYTDFTGRTPVNTWIFYNEEVEKLSCFDNVIKDCTRNKTIIVKKESDPIKIVTITLFDKNDTFTRERITKIQKDLKNVHSMHIMVEREHVDAAKQLLKDFEVYDFVKLFPKSDFRKITIYARDKKFVETVERDWDYKVSRLSRGDNSRCTPEQNEKPVSSSSYLDKTGNRMHSKVHCVCTTKEQLKVFVYCQSILEADVDVIVNAANEVLDHCGGVAAVIAKAAGPKLTDESNDLVLKYRWFHATNVVTTSGGNLRYQFVLHVIGPRWKMYPNKMDCLTDLEKTIINVLHEAKTIGFKSIALPAISAGLFEVPQELCAEVYAIAIHKFSKEHGITSSLRDIHFVDVDPIMIQKIKDAFEYFEKNRTAISLVMMKARHPNIQWTSPSSSVYTPESRSLHQSHRSSNQNTAIQHHGLPSHQKRAVTPSQSGSSNQHQGQAGQQNRVKTPSQGGRTSAKLFRLPDMPMANIPVKCFQFKNGLTVKVYTGSIVKFRGDAIVISADTTLTGSGFLGEAVRKAGGQDYEKEFERMKKMKSFAKPGDVLYCKGGKIGARNVIHLVLSQLSSTLEQKMNEYKKCLMNALEEINGRSWKKVAMPLLGAGFIEKDMFDLQKCCLAWFYVLSDFTFNKEHTCHIDEVHLINKNPKITSTLCDTFESNCSKDPNTAFNSHGQKSNRSPGRQTEGAHSAGPRTGGNADNLGSSFRNNGHGPSSRGTGLGSSLRESGHRSSQWESRNGSSFRNKSAIDIERRGQQGIEKSRGNRSSADLNQSGARPKEPLRRSHSTPQATDVDKEFDVEAFFQTNQSSRTKTTGNLNIIDSGTEDSEEEDLYEDVSSFKDKSLKSKNEEESALCVICLSDITNGMKLDCGHEFCKECLQQSFQQHKQACPVCGTIYGIVKGNQPENGTMRVKKDKYSSLPGYEGLGTITIKYYFPNGVQGPEHPNPGQSYEGTERRGFLPDNEEGRKVLRLLQKAFDRRLTFTIGHSRTTGKDNIVTWNDIHHKTKRDTGAQGFGYPDPTYLQRVQEELAAKGVTE